MSRLAEESAEIAQHFKEHDYLHLDVMDGHFVPNLTFGAPVIKSLRKHTKATLDAHLMVSDPAQWVDDMADAGVDRLTFHIEATEDPAALIRRVKGRGMKVGIALKPKTPADCVFPYCEDLVSAGGGCDDGTAVVCSTSVVCALRHSERCVKQRQRAKAVLSFK
eukprot:TRINITY_DN1453_c0_g1_i1.p2 TRINITY_DN1453_c0_g1~~TRINITY_DN1453_c0_g1_i1.p2  ORF type:complete len:164 (-),score=40.43 TRINITY_DN1453_c0_g1_i1:1193-1684(-)